MLTKGEDYHLARPSLVAHKRRAMELVADQPQKKGSKRGASEVVLTCCYDILSIKSLTGR